MARRAVSPRHGLITGLGPVSVPIFTHAGRRSRGTDDSYVLSRAWTTFRWAIFFGLVNESGAGAGRLLGGQDRDGPLAAEGKLLASIHRVNRGSCGRVDAKGVL